MEVAIAAPGRCPVIRQREQKDADTVAPSFVPPRYDPPSRWPTLWRWLAASRSNALALFPAPCFDNLHVAHRLLHRRLVVLSDPAAIALVTGALSGDFGLTNMHRRMLSPALGNGLIVAEGKEWRRQRRAAIKLLARTRARPSPDFVETRIAALVTQLRPSGQGAEGQGTEGRGFAIQPVLAAVTIDLLVSEMFEHHRSVGDARVSDAIDRHRALVERVDLFDMFGAPKWLDSRRLRRARGIARHFDPEIQAAIAQGKDRVAHRERHFDPEIQAAIAEQGAPILPSDFSAEQKRDLVVNLMAGFESVSTSAGWLLGLIAAHRALGDWLIDGDVDGTERARRLDAAIRETLRLYPPLPMIYRHALRDVDLPSGRIRRGDMVCISPYVVQRHGLLWTDPDRFDPGRWLGGRPPGPFLAFGDGARACPGRALGTTMIARIVGGILAELRPRPSGPLPVPRAGLSLRPASPLILAFERV